jgi:sterol desaturase/sphingolipid hydroxylase (fatty acid hydroxylase superfamily)
MPGLPLADFPWWQIWAINFALMLARYLVFAGGAFVVFYLIGRARFAHRRIQPKLPKRADYLREVGYSLSTFCIFGFVALGVVHARNNGQTLIYDRIADYGWGWFALSVVLMILLHDTYFYWTHRLMHWRPLFKHVHLVHHLSTNPSPWASFAFHPFEAVVEAGILPLIVVLIPAHPLALFLFLIYMTGMNVLGHLGYEFYPRWFLRNALTNWNNTSTHHALHHQFFTGNYGLYFNWWDRWMGTNQARYQGTFERVAAQSRDEQLQATSEAHHQTA